MKKLLSIGIATLALSAQAVETQLVCHARLDNKGNPMLDKKTGKPAQNCKTIRIHQKFEGTVVPEKSSKK
jgi:hypothetical protein